MTAKTEQVKDDSFYSLFSKAQFFFTDVIKEGESYLNKKLFNKQIEIARDQYQLFIDILKHHENHLDEYSLAKVDHLYHGLQSVYNDVIESKKLIEQHKTLHTTFAKLHNTFMEFYDLFLKVHDKAQQIAKKAESKQTSITSMQSVYNDFDPDEDEYWNSFLNQ